jgi:hypothetical protein
VWTAGASATAGRAHGLTLGTVAAVAWMRTVVLPAFGQQAALAFSRRVRPLVTGTPFHPAGPWFGLFLLVTLVMLVTALALGAPKAVRWRLAGGYLLATAGSIVGSLGDVGAMLTGVEGNARYAFVSGVMLLWLVSFNLRRVRSVRGAVCAVVLVCGLAPRAWQWRGTLRWRPGWPAWPAEVAAWQRDPRTPLQIWPRGWKVLLRPEGP